MARKFFKAMFCVTFFSVVTRALGFLLKVYLSRKMPSDMLGSYQVAMSIFGVLMTLVSSGIPVVLSRSVSYYHGQRDKRAIGSIVSSGLILTGLICSVVSLIVLLCPNFFNLIFTSSASGQMLTILMPALVFSSIYEVLRGALWGQQKFFIISFTEFIEQVVRIVVLVLLFETALLDTSMTNMAAISLSVGCIVSAVVVIIIYFKRGGKLYHPKFEFKKLLKTSTPITAVRTVSSVVSSIIAIIIPIKLMDFGYSSTEALSQYGIIMGMTFPLIMIPSTLISSLAVTIIPTISEQSDDIDSGKLKDTTILRGKINFSIRTTVVFSMLLLPAFVALGIPICKFLYNNEQAGLYLTISSIIMLPLGISQITTSILNAIGLELKSLKNYAISATLLILSILFLPKYIGIYSLVVGYVLMSVTTVVLNLIMLKKRGLVNLSFLKTIFTMLLISLGSGLLGFFIFNLLPLSLFLSLLISGGVVMGTMLMLVCVFNVANFKFILFRNRKSHR